MAWWRPWSRRQVVQQKLHEPLASRLDRSAEPLAHNDFDRYDVVDEIAAFVLVMMVGLHTAAAVGRAHHPRLSARRGRFVP